LPLYFIFDWAPVTNLGPETGFLDGFRRFSQYPKVDFGILPEDRPLQLPSTSFETNYSDTTLSFDAI
jgi:hypothetical protein